MKLLKGLNRTWCINDGEVRAEFVLNLHNNLPLPKLMLPFQACILILDILLQNFKSSGLPLSLLMMLRAHLPQGSQTGWICLAVQERKTRSAAET